MTTNGADEVGLLYSGISGLCSYAPLQVALETEFDNAPALALYSSLGFLREKRLFRFYMNGKDAYRLVKPLRRTGQGPANTSGEVKESWDGEWTATGYIFAPLSPTPSPAPLALLYA